MYEKWPQLSEQLISYAKSVLQWNDLDILHDKSLDELTLGILPIVNIPFFLSMCAEMR